MPGGDRTGPWGAGPMTGRGAGYCTGNAVPDYGNSGARAAFWCRGKGGGWGWRNWYYETGLTGWQRGTGVPGQGQGAGRAAISREEELAGLKGQAEYMQSSLNDIRRQIETLEGQDRKDSK